MCRRAQLNMAGLTGMTYNPFTQRYALEADASVNYILHATR
jgi:2-polyprenyl-6-hydroxyphenyl methylase/3-demethylubiquinone-9 3-methyltransferase